MRPIDKPEVSPADVPAAKKPRPKRIPMSVPQQRLQVPPIEGFHLHWFVEKNIERAIQAGYQFVGRNEVRLNNHSPAGAPNVSGNTDLGSNVSIGAGVKEDGSPERLTLMKIEEEYFQEDQKIIEQRNAKIMSAIFRDEYVLGSDQQPREDQKNMYVKTALFQRPRRKA